MRNLASIKKISEIRSIEGRDRIELAIIDGWSVIVKKDEFRVGDLCVYCEIDSLLPEKPEFEFLRSKDFHIKTMKMAGVISQGICFPLSILPDGEYRIGQDVTEILGIKKWERPDATDTKKERKAARAKYPKWLMRFKLFREWVYKRGEHRESKGFPSFISKTDETRIQNAPHFLSMDEQWVFTEKIDGQSGTFALVRRKPKFPWQKESFEYIVCSRNVRLYNKDGSSYWNVSEKYHIEKVLKQLIGNDEWVAIQGECIAPNVQGNKYKVKEPDLYVFNLIKPSGRIGSIEAKRIIESVGMKFVPFVQNPFLTLPATVSEMLEFAHGESALGNTIREGLVCRTLDGKFSFKAVDPLFLIKYNE